MDNILKRKPRTFKITYILKNKKILKSVIDTLSGFTKTSMFNNKKYDDFKNYCQQHELEASLGMNKKQAEILKASLLHYKASLK